MVGKLIAGFFSEDLRAVAEPAARRAMRCATPSPSWRSEVGGGRKPEEVADGFIKIAVENMANAIKKISVQRGYDVTRYALNCFGGAGGQHACLVADALGMTKVLIHPFSSLLSAYGMGLADIRATRQQAIELPFGPKALAAHQAHRRAARRARRRREVVGQGVPAAKIKVHRARAYPLRRHRHGAGGRRPARLPTMKRRLRSARTRRASASSIAPSSSWSRRVGRSRRRRRHIPREGDARSRATKLPCAGAQHAILLRRRMARRRVYTRDQLKPGNTVEGRRHHHRAAPDHRRRGRLAGGGDAEESSRAHARRDAQAHARDRHRMPIR